MYLKREVRDYESTNMDNLIISNNNFMKNIKNKDINIFDKIVDKTNFNYNSNTLYDVISSDKLLPKIIPNRTIKDLCVDDNYMYVDINFTKFKTTDTNNILKDNINMNYLCWKKQKI